MQAILEHGGYQVFNYGNEINKRYKSGKPVAVPDGMLEKLEKQSASRRKQGDSARFERVYESDATSMVGQKYDTRSLADFFPVDRRSGHATSIHTKMQRNIAPQMATQVCCATDIPILSPQRKTFTRYTGFAHLVVATDDCVWDTMAAEEQGVDLREDINLVAVREALDIAANQTAIDGDEENSVLGLHNNPYISTVIVEPFETANPINSLRSIASQMVARNSSIVDLRAGALSLSHTLFLPMDRGFDLCNTYVTFANEQVSLMSILTGATGTSANDPAVPKFRVVLMSQLNKPWYDGNSSVGYLFASGNDDFGGLARWWKPFSFLELGSETKGLQSQVFFGAKVGSIEFTQLDKVLRLVFTNPI